MIAWNTNLTHNRRKICNINNMKELFWKNRPEKYIQLSGKNRPYTKDVGSWVITTYSYFLCTNKY